MSIKSVALLGLGPSITDYLEMTKRLGGRHKLAEQTWCINALGNVFDCDLVFHMDDIRIQEIRAKAQPESNIAAMVEWLKTCKTPVITSRKHEDYPALIDFPLEEVINKYKIEYFNSTAAYAIAYAIHMDVKRLIIFGHDYTYPDAHDAEKGRACCEFWCGIAIANGVKIDFPPSTTLMDAIYTRDERLYGYDTVDVHSKDVDGRLEYSFTEKAELPTAAEIEERYDHTKHPNALVEDEPSNELESGERQVAPTVEGVRRDHVARYEWASEYFGGEGKSIIDICCGVGYGSNLLAKGGSRVVAVDRSVEAIAYAEKHYSHDNIGFKCADVTDMKHMFIRKHDVSICFECIEHIENPMPLLKNLNSNILLASVPNEEESPGDNVLFHYRHYTRRQFEDLLNDSGWYVTGWYGQEGPYSEVEPVIAGRTLIAACKRSIKS